MRTRNILITSTAAVIAAVAIGAGGAQAAGVDLFGSKHIADDSVRSIDIKNGTLQTDDMSARALTSLAGGKGARGPVGPEGKQGASGLAGAFYATAFYDNGDTNAGAIASVACDPVKIDYVAISGGVQVLGLDANANTRNTPVSSSFPGRMDWSTNTPRPDRLDGWIVQFGGNAGATSDKAPEKVKVWALCVPGANISVNQTFQQAG